MATFRLISNTNKKVFLTSAQKNANRKQYYKDTIDRISNMALSNSSYSLGEEAVVSDYWRMKVNYDLFNNKIDNRDFEYVCKPFGAVAGELPARMVNRDIVSGKIKVLLGMEQAMPFSWKVMAVNKEATTRKEKEEFSMIQEFVKEQVMGPIRKEIMLQQEQELKGQELTPQERKQIEQRYEEEYKVRTPDEVRRYMLREHQDPAEVLGEQIMQYLKYKEKLQFKFSKGWKHACISGKEIYWVGILNGEPSFKVINPLRFEHDRSSDIDFIEDGEWACNEYRMSVSEVIQYFSGKGGLKESEIEDLQSTIGQEDTYLNWNFSSGPEEDPNTICVRHAVWKGTTKIGFLTYLDEEGVPQMDIVPDFYRFNRERGDISIEWEDIPEVYEGWKVGNDKYAYMRPVVGQHKDLDNLYDCKLPYHGAVHDGLNSDITSIMDRVKYYQYFYNIICYRIELLMASDKGKILMMNIKAIPKSAGINTAKFQYFLEANKIGYLNTQEEGFRGPTDGAITNLVKEIDMSLVSNINSYMQMAEYIESRCGASIGITKQMEGMMGPDESVTGMKQSLVQSSHIVRPYFNLHNAVKQNVLQSLLETAKVAWSTGRPKKLFYILDDMSKHVLEVDQGLLSGNTLGLFLTDGTKADEAKQLLLSLTQPMLQNDKVDASDILAMVRTESVQESEEILKASELRNREREESIEREKIQAAKDLKESEQEFEREKWQKEADLILLKGELDNERVINSQLIESMGFNEDKDMDDDGVPDILELAKHALNESTQKSKLNLEREKFNHTKQQDKKRQYLEEEKLKIANRKVALTARSKPKKKSK